jgi:hypothetical protein
MFRHSSTAETTSTPCTHTVLSTYYQPSLHRVTAGIALSRAGRRLIKCKKHSQTITYPSTSTSTSILACPSILLSYLQGEWHLIHQSQTIVDSSHPHVVSKSDSLLRTTLPLRPALALLHPMPPAMAESMPCLCRGTLPPVRHGLGT